MLKRLLVQPVCKVGIVSAAMTDLDDRRVSKRWVPASRIVLLAAVFKAYLNDRCIGVDGFLSQCVHVLGTHYGHINRTKLA